METWKDIKNYEGIYQVSNLGRVKVLDRYIVRKRGTKSENTYHVKGRILRPGLDSVTGYYGIKLCKNGIKESFKIHRLVAVAFIENTYDKKYINHKNSIRTDNNVSNLEWVTQSENIKHAHNSGRCTKMNEEKIGKLILDQQNGIFYFSCRDAGKSYGVTQNTLSQYLSGRRLNKTNLIYV